MASSARVGATLFRGGCVLLLLYASTLATVGSSSGSVTYEVDARGSYHHHLLLEELPHHHQLLQQQQQQHQRRQEETDILDSHHHHQQQLQKEQADDGAVQQDLNDQDLDDDDECGLYLAPSTLEGAGLGIFTSRPRSIGETVGFEELVIPMVEIPFYNGNKNELFNPFVSYYWRGSEKGLHGIVSPQRENEVQGFVPGLDAATNCNLALINVDMSGSQYDGSNLNRYYDPMAGAMTPYHTTPSDIIRDIPAGGELFKFYGDRWFVAREEQFGVIPLSEDYVLAQKLVDKFDQLRQDHFSSNPSLADDLWALVKKDIGGSGGGGNKEVGLKKRRARGGWESRTMKALPKTVQDARQAAKHEIASLFQPQAIRSNDFLKRHGRCIDSIKPGPSTLESGQGGRGGFATRHFGKGQVVTGSPLHHIPNKELVTIYRMEQQQQQATNHTRNNNSTNTRTTREEETWMRFVDEGPIGYQMMLNYCYGHQESTLLLCPYGQGVGYINHNQTRANVKIQWAPHGAVKQNHTWLQSKQLVDLEFDYEVGLAFDYVATRDIAEGEELFLDYGDEFELALTRHMSNWRQPQKGATKEEYIAAEIFNTMVANSTLRTDSQQALHPYPDNVEMRCHPGLVHKEIRAADQNENGDLVWETRETGYPCRVLEHYSNEQQQQRSGGGDNQTLYKVELTLPLDEIGRQHVRDKFNYVQKKDVRRTSIRFFNKPYTTDLFLSNTFRKEIGIPDDMFPEHWKNSPS